LKAVDVEAESIGQKTRKVLNTGFQEAEMDTGRTLFDWDPIGNGVKLTESCDTEGREPPKGANPATWDFFHINSVDKFMSGDYLVSARHMSTLYKISKDDGHIIWRLGGCHGESDFELEENLPFFWQHHARVRYENSTHTILSVFDNASEDRDRGEPKGHNPPVGKIIILDHAAQPPTAKMLRRFDRPDKGQTAALGSVSVLGDDPVETASIFIDWAFEGYVSEYDWHDGQNRLVMEAKFVSDRKRSYRAYKFPFVGDPTEPPVMALKPIGYGQDEVASAFYVSWNGATEVKEWAFYGGDQQDERSMKLLATIKKRGFETEWVTPGMVKFAHARALDTSGAEIGRTAIMAIDPILDPDYIVYYPALQGANLAAPRPQIAAMPHESDVWVGSDSDTASDYPPPTTAPVTSRLGATTERITQQLPSFANQEASNAAYLVVDAFAVFGLYFVVKSLVQRFNRRRKGYGSLPAYDDR